MAIELGRPEAGIARFIRFEGFLLPQCKRTFIPRNAAIRLMIGIEDLGDEPLLLPVDTVAFRIDAGGGLYPFSGTVLVDIRDDLHPLAPVGIGEDIIAIGRLDVRSDTGDWSWRLT